MPDFKDISKLSPLPIVNLHEIGIPADGLLIPVATTCIHSFPMAPACRDHYQRLAKLPAETATVHQCPFGFCSLVVKTKSLHVALTGVVPYPRLGGRPERAVAKRHKTHRIPTTALSHAAEAIRGAIHHFENLESASVKKYSVALHEIRKLNGKVKQIAERLCREQNSESPESADARLVRIWKSAELMSQQFDAVELLANESLARLPLQATISVYQIFDKCVRIYTPAEADPRIRIHGEYGYTAQVHACDKTFSIIPSVLIENALKYSIEGSQVDVHIKPEKGRCVVTVTNRTKVNRGLTEKVFQKGVRASGDGDGSGNGLYLAQLVVAQHRGTIGLATRQLTADTMECTFTVTLPDVGLEPQSTMLNGIAHQ